MNSIECNFCKKENLFTDDEIRKSGKGELITCENCSRSIIIAFNNKKYYKNVDK